MDRKITFNPYDQYGNLVDNFVLAKSGIALTPTPILELPKYSYDESNYSINIELKCS